MKTKRVRPLLVESKDNENRQYPCILKHSYMFGNTKGKIGYYDCNIRTATIAMELILIPLEDEKIKIGDLYIMDGILMNPVQDEKEADRCNNHPSIAPFCKKIIACQSQISPEYISKFIEQYNNNCVEDLEIEMESVDKCKRCGAEHGSEFKYVQCQYPVCEGELVTVDRPKLTNGFITIVNKKPNQITLLI